MRSAMTKITFWRGRLLDPEEQPTLRVSHVYTYFALRDPTKSLTDEDNYASSALSFNADRLGKLRRSGDQEDFVCFIPFGGRAVALVVGAKILSRYSIPPRRIGFEIFREHDDIPNRHRLIRSPIARCRIATGARTYDLPGHAPEPEAGSLHGRRRGSDF